MSVRYDELTEGPIDRQPAGTQSRCRCAPPRRVLDPDKLTTSPDAPPTDDADGADGADARPARAAQPPPASGARPPRPGRRLPQGAGHIPRADRPGNVPAPQHHHLPGWVRRDYARSRPALADLLGLLQGEDRATLERRVEELTEGISGGRFSLAWQYPDVIAEGRRMLETQQARLAEQQRATRQLEAARRRAADRLRDAADLLAADALARLSRALRSAPDAAAIAEVEAEADRALSTARSSTSRRREREIERTRSRLHRTLPKAAVVEEPQAETWQDVLRRFAEENELARQD